MAMRLGYRRNKRPVKIDHELVLERLESGDYVGEIARDLNVSYHAIWQIAKRNNIKIKKVPVESIDRTALSKEINRYWESRSYESNQKQRT